MAVQTKPVERLPEHSLRSDATLADLALMGFAVGKACAQRLHRGYATSPLQPDQPLAVILRFANIVDVFITDQQTRNRLTRAGELAYRAGYQRGFDMQLQNPDANVILKIRRPGE